MQWRRRQHWLTAGRLFGGGDILARGGLASLGTGLGGGGGRISVTLTATGATFDDFDGAFFAGGQGPADKRGGPGTIYLQTGDQGQGRGTVLVDAGGITTTAGAVLPPQLYAADGELRHATLVATNAGTRVKLSAYMEVGDLLLYPGTVLELGGYDLKVRQERYALDGSVTTTGGQILWLSGTMFMLR